MELSCTDILEFHCPRWSELPEIELYMDQVVSILEKVLRVFSENTGEGDEKPITSMMINNYVKQKVITPPRKKRYDRTHLSYLILVSLLKRVLSLSEISTMIAMLLETHSIENAYNLFCDELENSIQIIFAKEENLAPFFAKSDSPDMIAIKTVSFAMVNKLYAQRILQGYRQKKDIPKVKK